MAIPEISMISDFEAGMKCLQNPSIISRSLPLSGIQKVPQVYSFWKWGAVIIALVATFSGIINRIKLLIIRIRKSLASSSSDLLLQHFIDDDDFSDDDDSLSLTSEDDDFETESTSSYEDEKTQNPVDEDFSVAGSSSHVEYRWQNANFNLRRRFSWSDFTSGKSVVKLWDGLGLSLNLKDCSGSVISIWDFNNDQIHEAVAESPAILSSAGVNENDTIVLKTYDRRMRDQTPAIHAEWRPSPAVATVRRVDASGIEKVYVRDGVTGALTVGDLRNVKTPLENLSDFDGDTWWDANAVIFDD